MKRYLLAACVALAATPLLAAVPTAKIQALLAKPAMLCGRFDQSKQLVGMKKPLLSNGRFCVAAGKGVLWRTLQPFPNTLRLTRDEIVHLQGERVTMRLDAQQEPVVRMINGVLFSLLAGDLTQLETLFDGDGSVDGKHWRVALKAREAGLAKVISGVALEGGAYVNAITLNEANGDRTSIVFSAMQTGDSAIAADEAVLF
jgi:hypothetical protein